MATSGTYSFTVTRDDIIKQALLNIGKLDPEETVSPWDTENCSRVLNMMCKQWMGKSDFAPGLKMWTRRHGHLFLSASTGTYQVGPTAPGWTNSYTQATTVGTASQGVGFLTLNTIGNAVVGGFVGVIDYSGNLVWYSILFISGTTLTLSAPLQNNVAVGSTAFVYGVPAQQPLKVETAFLRDSNNDDTPLKIMTLQDYDYLPSKADPNFVSDPTAIYYEFQLGNSTLFTDCAGAQDVTKHICMSYMEPIQDFNAPLDNPEYPQEWYLALCWGLSEQIAPMKFVSWSEKMESLKNDALAIARHKDPEIITLYFQPGAED